MNVAILTMAGGLSAIFGFKAYLLIQLIIVAVSGGAGVWLFYVQHQYERTYWARKDRWNATEAALHGSSHYLLPRPLGWITANIGVHHVHHVDCRIPFYRLPEVLRDNPELTAISRLSIAESIRSARLSLWDEVQQRLISFRQLHALGA
jgi:omega-6 fatty acid desaturase (delta-12 desaturase)